MTREEKIKLAIEKGITCNPETGQVFGVRGKEMINKLNGYICIGIQHNNNQYKILAHQFIWYVVKGEIVEFIDHINGVRDDNRISNLRSVTKQENSFNTKAKGYCWHKTTNKWISYICLNNKVKYLGVFNEEDDARNAYLEAKEKYHII